MLFPRSMRPEKYAATSVCFARVSRTHSEMLRAQRLKWLRTEEEKKGSSISLIWFTYCSSSVGHGRKSLDIFVLQLTTEIGKCFHMKLLNNRKVLGSTTSTAMTHHSWEFDWLHEAGCTCGTHCRTIVCHALTFAVLTTTWTKNKKI